MVIYGLYMAIYGPYMTIYGPYMAIYSPYMARYSPYMAIYGHTWPDHAQAAALGGAARAEPHHAQNGQVPSQAAGAFLIKVHPPFNKKTCLSSRVWPFLILVYICVYQNKKLFFRPRVWIFFLHGLFSARGV